MTCVILFPTTAKANVNTINDLNKKCSTDSRPLFFNSFTPASKDAKKTAAPSMDATEFQVDRFDDSEEKLEELFTSKYKSVKNGEYEYASSTFAVLDDRGVKEKNIVIYSEDTELDEDEEPNGPTSWRSWRVRWSDSYDLVEQLEGESMEVVDRVLSDTEAFTDAKGVFDFHKAMADKGYRE